MYVENFLVSLVACCLLLVVFKSGEIIIVVFVVLLTKSYFTNHSSIRKGVEKWNSARTILGGLGSSYIFLFFFLSFFLSDFPGHLGRSFGSSRSIRGRGRG